MTPTDLRTRIAAGDLTLYSIWFEYDQETYSAETGPLETFEAVVEHAYEIRDRPNFTVLQSGFENGAPVFRDVTTLVYEAMAVREIARTGDPGEFADHAPYGWDHYPDQS